MAEAVAKDCGPGAGLVLTALLLWSNLGAEDGVTEVLARRGEVVAGRFIEVPCSEDYDSHRRFEGCTPGNAAEVSPMSSSPGRKRSRFAA